MHTLLHKTEVFHWIKYLTDKTQKMATIKIKQVRSKIKSPKDQKLTLEALGLKKMNAVVEHEATPQILGMVAKVKHLVEVIN
jgi:large subunit ribosomal protein L30